MKKMIFVLAMLLTAATTYTQTSKKPANNSSATSRQKPTTTVTRSNSSSTNDQVNNNTVSRRTENTTVTTTRSEQTNTQKPVGRETNARQPINRETSTQKPNSRETNYVDRNNNSPNNDPAMRRDNNERRENTNGNSRSRETNWTPTNQRPVIEYESPRVYRENHQPAHRYQQPPAHREYRSVHYVYRRPVNYEVYWTPIMHRHFINIYPMVSYWNYYNGYPIGMISAYDAIYYRGDVRTVYGEVFDIFYSWNTDEYFLYFGTYYPFHDFTVIMPGYLARRYSHNPERFFQNQYMAVTGLITSFNGEPEIVVKESFQINIY